MKKKMAILLILVLGVFLIGCSKNKKIEDDHVTDVIQENEEQKEQEDSTGGKSEMPSMKGALDKDNFPKVDGSTATIPLSERIYQYTTGASKEEAEATIVHTKTSQSYYKLMEGEADLLIVYEPSQDVLDYQKDNNHKLLMKPIGKDALVFMANSSNTVDSLTTEQLVDIYSGTVTNWSQVGGENKEMLAFQRPEGSGSQTLMEKHVMKGTAMASGVNVSYYSTMEGILEAMAQYSNTGNSLGYSVFYYAKNMYQLPELRFMKINGIEPTMETIYDNSYPYINEFYAVIREDEPEDSKARLLFDWLTEEEGQKIVAEEGYVPVSMEFKYSERPDDDIKAKAIPEGYCYVATNKLWGDIPDSGSVSIYRGNWEKVADFIAGEIGHDYGLQPTDRKIIIGISVGEGTSQELMYGLYDLSKLEFIIEPQYDSMWRVNEVHGTYVVGNQSVFSLVDEKNQVLLTGFEQVEGMGVSSVGDYYWVASYDPQIQGDRIIIYDANMKEVNRIEKSYDSDPDAYKYVYHSDGTPLITRELFFEKMNIPVEDRNISAEFIVFSDHNPNHYISIIYKDTAYLFDINWNLITSKDKGLYDDCYIPYDVIYADKRTDPVTRLEYYLFYDKEMKQIKAPTGEPYTNLLEYNYFSYNGLPKEDQIVLYEIIDSMLYVYNVHRDTTTQIDLGSWTDITIDQVRGNLIVVRDKNGENTKIYKGNEMLYHLQGDYSGAYLTNESRFLILQQPSSNGLNSYNIIIDGDGTMLYQSEYPEIIKSVDEYYIQVHRGSYYMIIDYDGNVARKDYRSNLHND